MNVCSGAEMPGAYLAEVFIYFYSCLVGGSRNLITGQPGVCVCDEASIQWASLGL